MTPEIEQLYTAMQFMADTPCVADYHTELWWTGEMPAHPELYDPEDWEESNWPIWKVWDLYLAYLYDEADKHESIELWEHYCKAFDLQITDLLQENEFKKNEVPLSIRRKVVENE